MKKHAVLVMLFAAAVSGCDSPDQFNPLLQPFRLNDARGLEVILSPESILERGTAVATALVIRADGRKEEAESVAWECADAAIAAIDGAGIVTGLAPGRGRIVARVGAMSATAEVQVRRRIDYSRVLISEVFYDAAGADDGVEFIELYNGNDYPLDAAGMVLTDGSSASRAFVFPEGSLVGAGARIVAAQSREGFFGLFGAYPDCGFFTFSLNNAGEAVFLSAPDGTRVDAVFIKGGTEEFRPDAAWGSAVEPSAPSGSSVYRTGTIDTDTCADWASGAPSPGRP